jgi:hypothetical protein
MNPQAKTRYKYEKQSKQSLQINYETHMLKKTRNEIILRQVSEKKTQIKDGNLEV